MAVTNYIWDDLSDNILMETDENGAVIAEYTNEPGVFGGPISQHRNGENSFFCFDGDGSTRQVTDSDQHVTDTETFTAYGEEVSKTGSTNYPFRYKGIGGYYSDIETGEIYVRARTYGPDIGRWLSTDPLRFVDGVNVYAAYFVPSGLDPSGLYKFCQTITRPPRAFASTQTNRKCGGFDAAVKWSFVDAKGYSLVGVDGSIIQRVTGNVKIYDCDSGREFIPPPLDFYELWHVNDGDVTADDPETLTQNVDWNERGNLEGSLGIVQLSFEVMFARGYNPKFPPWRHRGENGHVIEGGGNATLKPGPPSNLLWHTVFRRSLVVFWACCPCLYIPTVIIASGWEDKCGQERTI